MQWFFLLFPFFELWTLIELGAATSPLLAVGWVVLGIVLGMSMIRRQGLNMIRQAQRDAEGGFITPRFLADDLAVVTSGFLLMVPGLVTDLLALVVLIGPLRRGLLGMAPASYRSQSSFHAEYRSESGSGQSSGSSERVTPGQVTIEGDFQRVEDRDPPA